MDQEEKWIRDIQRRGSRAAAERLIEGRYDEIYRFAYRQAGNKEDAMDLTQNIFMAALRSLPGYDRKKASFRTWLYRIAANKAIDARRRAGPCLESLEEEEEAAEAADFTAQVQDRALLEEIEAFVSGLDPEVQAVFRLRAYGGRSFPEIAAALDRPESAVKSQYYRLIGRLRKEFDPYG